MKMFKFGAVALGAMMALSTAAQADTVKIAINEWTGQNLSAHLTGALFGELGLDVEYVTAGAVPQFAAIADGSLHIQPETWTNNVGDIYPKAVESGDIQVIGDLGLAPEEGWIYPPYMEEKCPGLPAYQALYDCAQAFAAADTFPNGRLITYPADWGTRSKDLVALLDLPFAPVPGGSEGAMLAELQSAVDAKEPMLMMFWQPHWVHAAVDVNWVKWDGELGADCDEGNQKRGDACGFQQASVKKIATKDFGSAFPKAMKVFQAMSLDNATQNAMILEVDDKKREVEEVVADWMKANEATWKPWVEAAQ